MNQESALEKLLARLEAEPFAKERKELGYMLMRHIADLSPQELERYKQLTEILTNTYPLP